MRKFTLLIASLFITIGAMAQTFVEPEVGKFYKIKGDHGTNHWVAVTTAGSSVAMSSNEDDAAVFLKTTNGFQEVTTKNYLGYTGGKFTFNSTALTVELRNTGGQANSEGKYAIVSGGNYMYNNSNDGIAHESTAWLDIPRLWGFIEVEYDDEYNGKVFRLTTYSSNNFNKYLYQKTDGTTDLYYNGTDDDTRAYWKFEMVTMGVYNIKNIHTGLYIDVLTGNNDFVNMSETAPGQYEVITQIGTETSADGKYYIKKVGADCSLHSTDGSGKVKGWNGGGLGNQYVFTEITDFSHTLSIGATGYATLCLGFDAEIPVIDGEGNGVFIATPSTVAGNVHLTQIAGVLPAKTAVIVKAPANTDYEFAYSTSTENYADVDENLLTGTLYDKTVAGEAYVLGIIDGVVGLYKATTSGLEDGRFKNNANKAYLPAGNVANLSAAFYGFDWEGTTGINEVKGENGNVKAIFDLTGRRVETITAPGIYIVGGRKVLVK
ncbi:MAG: hypothetical protein IKL56_03860 [Bacteroidaceae bacterium]|nr:hypothetical protein [Bacteroidaceae bacterium]